MQKTPLCPVEIQNGYIWYVHIWHRALNIVNTASKIKDLEPGERHLKKTNWILSKAVEWLSMTNNQHHGEGWWGHQRNRRCERSRGSWWDRLHRQASGQRGAIPLLRRHNWTISHCGQLGYCVHDGVVDNPAVDFFQAWDLVSFELRAPNLALNEIVNWPDFTSEAEKEANNLSRTISTDWLVESIPANSLTHYHENMGDDFIDIPRTFIVYKNETAEADRHRGWRHCSATGPWCLDAAASLTPRNHIHSKK